MPKNWYLVNIAGNFFSNQPRLKGTVIYKLKNVLIGSLTLAQRETCWQMIFLVDSDLYDINLSSKSSFSLGTFGLG